MFLDLGQKSFGVSKQCNICNMLYLIGDIDDEKRHSTFCSKIKCGPTLPSLKGLSILTTFNNEQDTIIEIKPTKQRRPQQDAIDAIMKIVETELGSDETYSASALSDSGTAGESGSILLYTRNKAVLGCLVTQQVSPGCLVALSKTVRTTDVNVPLPSDTSSPPDDAAPSCMPTSTTLGVRLIWTLNTARRQGIAGRLIDAARQCFEFGRVVPRGHVAFSQPTNDGLDLALGYCRKDEVWGFA